MPYPRDLEEWWLRAASDATACCEPAAALASLEAEAARLSDRFTVERPAVFSDYTAAARARAAYGVLFFPQTFVRVGVVLGEWLTGRKAAPACRILDLGSGLGASSLAAAMSLRDRAVSLTAVDYSPQALISLSHLFDACHALWPHATLQTQARDARADGLSGPFDLILASFVVNELFPENDDAAAERWMRSQISRLAPGGSLAIIEPAGAATCERLQRLRNRFASDPSISILSPCPHHRPCPMLGAECGYCHDVRSWHVPDSVNLINRKLLRSVNDLKHGLLVLGQKGTVRPLWDDDPSAFRMVAPMNRTKGRLVTRGCCGDGRLREIELQTRGLTRSQTDAICAWERGDVLRMVDGRPLGDGRVWRVAGLDPILVSDFCCAGGMVCV